MRKKRLVTSAIAAFGLLPTAMQVWRTGQMSSNKRVVRIYLPKMSLLGEAYEAATVTKYGLRDVRVNHNALANTSGAHRLSLNRLA